MRAQEQALKGNAPGGRDWSKVIIVKCRRGRADKGHVLIIVGDYQAIVIEN